MKKNTRENKIKENLEEFLTKEVLTKELLMKFFIKESMMSSLLRVSEDVLRSSLRKGSSCRNF
jgi:hypothetical protein